MLQHLQKRITPDPSLYLLTARLENLCSELLIDLMVLNKNRLLRLTLHRLENPSMTNGNFALKPDVTMVVTESDLYSMA